MSSFTKHLRTRLPHYLLFAALLVGCKQPHTRASTSERRDIEALSDRQVAVLNGLRDEINLIYGYRNGCPRINSGPCGRFAKAFREQWNTRFRRKINIVFVVIPDGTECYHVLVKLPGGSYFDGGNGVISGPTLLKEFPPGARIDEMLEFDLKRLDKNSGGLERSYPDCPDYADEITAKLIQRYLAMLPSDSEER